MKMIMDIVNYANKEELTLILEVLTQIKNKVTDRELYGELNLLRAIAQLRLNQMEEE